MNRQSEAYTPFPPYQQGAIGFKKNNKNEIRILTYKDPDIDMFF